VVADNPTVDRVSDFGINFKDTTVIRTLQFSFPAILLAGSTVVAGAQDVPAADNETPAPPEISQHDQALQAYGWMIGQERGLFFGYTEDELNQILIGIVRNARRLPEPENIRDLIPLVESIVSAKAEGFESARTQAIEAASTGNIAAGSEFIAKLVAEGAVEKTDTGLHYELVDEGIGRRPSGNDIVRIRYTGQLIDGFVFDSSETAESGGHLDTVFSGLIPGFREGLEMVREGGKIKLFIPPDLGYGDVPAGNIPPGSTLVVEVELIELNPMDFDVGGPESGSQ
jgi:FKBP-type peptidyl-prolyl cis-trans isomerase